MKLRKWQSECVSAVLNKFSKDKKHFLCLATPGAGKTTMAAEVVAKLFDEDLIDFVLCFSPGKSISQDIQLTLEARTSQRFDGVIGAKGKSYTYQSMPTLDDKIWELLREYRVFVIFDEIHHCSGTSPEDANAWGEGIIINIKHQAAYTLALTGTPWRSDNTPIALAEYQESDSHIICDYVYGLADAVQDGVCRKPQIVVTDNNDVSIDEADGIKRSFGSFSELLEETPCRYQKIVENKTVIRHIISQANTKLIEIRKQNPSAGGLVVATSVGHATNILSILQNELNVSAVIATYREDEPTTIIQDFKKSSISWIVSVGMISEGTNIPRLQVCCHLTRIKTELLFRQILGRILRMTHTVNQEACLFMAAEKTLVEFAYRVAEDIPEEKAVVFFEKSKTAIQIDCSDEIPEIGRGESGEVCYDISIGKSNEDQNIEALPPPTQPSLLTQTYEATLNVFGRFQQDILAVNLSPFD
tara:strand:- start:5332 stop:6750 length:1419 start_codon:yes stop_codon:yes gene_type:complete